MSMEHAIKIIEKKEREILRAALDKYDEKEIASLVEQLEKVEVKA